MKMRDFTYNIIDKIVVVLETTMEICHWRKGGRYTRKEECLKRAFQWRFGEDRF